MDLITYKKSWPQDMLYQKFLSMKEDFSAIGLDRQEQPPYFCTPAGAEIIGWDNGIHFVFVPGFDRMVFAVNPMPETEEYVFPVAPDFVIFLSLILTVGHTNVIWQMAGWSKEQFIDFVSSDEESEYLFRKEAVKVHKAIESLGLLPLDEPYEVVQSIQSSCWENYICFSDEYYECTGKQKPKGMPDLSQD